MPARTWKELLGGKGRNESISDEMHILHRWSIDTSDLPDADLDALLEPDERGFEGWLEEVSSTLGKKLASDGFPPPFEYVLSDGSDWRVLPEGFAEADHRSRWATFVGEGEQLVLGLAFIRAKAEPFSHPWFAALVAEKIAFYRTAQPANRPAQAYQIGHLIAVWRSRTHYATIRRGTKVKSAASDGGQARAAGYEDRNLAILSEMEKLIAAGHSNSRAAQLVH